MDSFTPDSTNIGKVEYDETRLFLTITFKTGGSYVYYPVPAEVFQAFRDAGSAGQFFARNIRGHYADRRL